MKNRLLSSFLSITCLVFYLQSMVRNNSVHSIFCRFCLLENMPIKQAVLNLQSGDVTGLQIDSAVKFGVTMALSSAKLLPRPQKFRCSQTLLWEQRRSYSVWKGVVALFRDAITSIPVFWNESLRCQWIFFFFFVPKLLRVCVCTLC